MKSRLKYKRVLLKLSGEAFGSAKKSIEVTKLAGVARELVMLNKLGCQVAVVVGGGNLWRKREQGQGMDEVTADYLGMLATVMNALALKQALMHLGARARVQSYLAVDTPGVEVVSAKAAHAALQRHEIVLFASGTGKPFVTTDTAAAQRAIDIKAHVIIKVGPADGVYTADPAKRRGASKFATITASEALRRKLGFMDRSALKLCRQHGIAIVVGRWQKGVLGKVVRGKPVGTLVTAD